MPFGSPNNAGLDDVGTICIASPREDIRMMNAMGNMMIGMGLLGWLLILVLVLIAAAAIKYLFFDRNRKK